MITKIEVVDYEDGTFTVGWLEKTESPMGGFNHGSAEIWTGKAASETDALRKALKKIVAAHLRMNRVFGI